MLLAAATRCSSSSSSSRRRVDVLMYWLCSSRRHRRRRRSCSISTVATVAKTAPVGHKIQFPCPYSFPLRAQQPASASASASAQPADMIDVVVRYVCIPRCPAPNPSPINTEQHTISRCSRTALHCTALHCTRHCCCCCCCVPIACTATPVRTIRTYIRYSLRPFVFIVSAAAAAAPHLANNREFLQHISV